EVLAVGAELDDDIVAGVADVDVVRRRTAGVVDGDAGRIRELAGAPAGNARLAARPALADLALRGAIDDAPAPGGSELPLGAEFLDPGVGAVGDVDLAGALIDGDADGRLELRGRGARTAELRELL